MENKIKVKKRDDSLEDFEYDKLLASITKAGVDIKDAEVVAQDIVGWTVTNAKDNIISSDNLRDEVIKRLTENFPAEADSYSAYKKV